MQTHPLGDTDIHVSRICLGTMTWGEQNTEAEAHSQLDRAVERGIQFIDTAEMYPVPPRAETQGQTERYLGTWLARRGRRDDLVLASKVTGPGEHFSYLRGGPQLTRDHLERALHDSLTRLQTDYLDLYQVHWPARRANYFGRLGYEHDPEDRPTPIEETLKVLADFVRAGKVRAIGISNETPWGLMQYLRLAEQAGLPRVVSIQNPYSLLNRSFEVGLAEMAIRERVGLLAYSPLAFGVLSGKYLDASPPDGRVTLYSRFSRYSGETGTAATRAYVDIAQRHGLSPARMALAFVHSRPFVTSTIIGATKMPQLEEDMDSLDDVLSEEVLAEIEAVHARYPIPCP
ncbi:NADP(H)-dependent aldo-keto reductase [Ectothiorhodospira mobilis]|uniref:NADP(H)-dependent aldo-keto reductase n=1 Tax=Ectothiorhodospira mobilis TaxID=195064 RepID=UPI001902E31C|nr:NADP(H)-dependent aldo-keto reductase [Ectothiorhodospira mobilis]MBK1692079.1 NADP(H)-dependent aldo-keto reductase [Ectothiorhodospira mobilis]